VRQGEPSLATDGYPPSFVPAAFRWVPPRVGSYGAEVVDFSASIGHPVDAEQADDLDAMCSFGPGGLPVADESCLIEGRQNGKTDRVILPWTLCDFFVGRARIVDWTAHLLDTTLKAKRIVDQLIAGNPELSRRVKRVVDARGSEEIILHQLPHEDAERSWRWTVRTDGAGRGGPADVWVADEALYLTPGMLGARRPTLRAREGSQLRLASSAGLKKSAYLASVVKRGRAGGDPGLIFVERAAPGSFLGETCALGEMCSHVFGQVEGCALDDESQWHHANHALARGRIRYGKLRQERAAATSTALATEFARETLGWHEAADAGEHTVSVDQWDGFEDRSSTVAEGQRPLVFVVGVQPGGAGAVAVGGVRADGRLHVGLVRYPSAGGELVGDALLRDVALLRAKHKPRRVLVLGGPASRTVRDDLARRVRALETVGPAEQSAAAADLLVGMRADDFRHRGDPIVRASLESSPPRRTTDGGWSFDTRAGGVVLPIVLVTVARWRAAQLRASAGRPGSGSSFG